MSLYFIPECLRNQKGWVLWKSVPQDQSKPIKLPIKFDGSSSGWNDTRYTFKECLANLTEDIAGLGLQPLKPYACLDVDNCIKNGKLNEFAKELLDFIDNTYVEYSPSGTGIHIWFEHDSNYTSMVNFLPGKQLELFSQTKYVTMTGKILRDAEVRKIDLESVVKKYFPKQSKGENNRVEDPYKKTGIIGAFNRTISIHKALNMTGKYEQVDATRYKYIPSKSPGGGLVYEGKLFQSNHASDPVFGGQHSAFDIVRIHKFGREQKYIKAMLDFCHTIPEVKHKLIVEEFGEDVKDWQKELDYSNTGKAVGSYSNITIILENNFNLKINEFNMDCELRGVPWYKRTLQLEDADYANFNAYFERVWGIKGKTKIEDCVKIVARKNAYHPVKLYLETLPEWDGVKRIERLLIDHMGADDTEYTKTVTRKVFAAAVQRIYNPGCKFDSVLTLVGPQGIGKSTMWLKLVGPDWFNDNLSMYDMKDKAASEKLMGQWIIEMAEMVGMRKTETETVKSFITRTTDKYRPAFSRALETFPRQCVFIATSNQEHDLLRDQTGGRRFWIVKVNAKIDFEWIEENRDQIWAEAMTLKNEPLVLPYEIEKDAADIQSQNTEEDDRMGLVEEFIEKRIPPDWYDKTLDERKFFDLDNPRDNWVPREFISTKEIYSECFKKNIFDMTRMDSFRITSILKRMGYQQKDNPKKIKGYGLSKVWGR